MLLLDSTTQPTRFSRNKNTNQKKKSSSINCKINKLTTIISTLNSLRIIIAISMIRYCIPLQYKRVVVPLSILKRSFRASRNSSSTSTTTMIHKDSHNNQQHQKHRIKKNPYWKTYCINGHTMDHNMNGTIGWTGTIPKSISEESTTTTTSKQQQQLIDNNTGTNTTNITNTNTNHHILYTDLPYNMGGTNKAVQPIELLLMSYIGCTQATAFYVSRQIHISSSSYRLQHIEFRNIIAERDIRGSIHPKSIPIINYTSSSTSSEQHINDDDYNDDHSSIPSRIQQLSGEIIVYFTSSTSDTKVEEGSTIQQQQQDTTSRRFDYLYTLQYETEKRCSIANMIQSSGCNIDHIVWKDGGEYQK